MSDNIDAQLLRARTLTSGEVMSDERLQEVFALVKDKENWKMPVDAVVHPEVAQVEEIEIAVTWFTGGGVEIWEEDGQWRVTAPGYYEEIGS